MRDAAVQQQGGKDLSKHMEVLPEAGPHKGAEHPEEAAEEAALNEALRKVSRVVLPLVFLAALMNYLDRTALSFAALQMNADLGLTAQEYGLAAGIFALGYGLGHIPFAYLAIKYGVRGFFAGMTAAWGLVAMAGALVHNSAGLAVQRVLLGLAESGAVPCAMHLLAQFYPCSRLTQPMTVSTVGLTMGTVIAAPLAMGLMTINAGGLRGWQWLYIIEGAPSVLLGIAMWFLLPSSPVEHAWMLAPEEQQLVQRRVQTQQSRAQGAAPGPAPGADSKHANVRELLALLHDAARRPMLWFFTLAGFLWVLCVHSLNAFMPLIIKNMLAGTAAVASTATGGASASNTRNATLLSAIPYLTAAGGMALCAWNSDRVNERTLHMGLSSLAAAVFWLCFGPMYRASFAAGFVSLVLTMTLAYCQMGVAYARIAEALDARHAAMGISIFNAIGAAIGGFLGPYVTGAVVQRMGSFVQATLIQGAFLLASGAMCTSLGLWEQAQKRCARRLLGGAEKRGAGAGGRGDAAC